MFLKQKEKTDHLKKALGNRWRATGEYADLVFVTTMGSPVLRYHAEKEIKKVVKEINEQEAFESVQEQREPHYFEDMYPHAIRHPYVKHKTKSFLRNSRVFKADFCAPSHSLCTEVFHFPDNINLISGVNIHTFNQCVSHGGI